MVISIFANRAEAAAFVAGCWVSLVKKSTPYVSTMLKFPEESALRLLKRRVFVRPISARRSIQDVTNKMEIEEMNSAKL
jgi:hypothetical protein